MADDLLARIVAALDQDVRAHGDDELQRGRLAKDDDCIDGGEGGTGAGPKAGITGGGVIWVNDMINSLDNREADILRMRFGLDGHDESTLEEVGRNFKVTRERVRQRQALALKRIRKLWARNEAQRSREEIEQDELSRKRTEAFRGLNRHPVRRVNPARGAIVSSCA